MKSAALKTNRIKGSKAYSLLFFLCLSMGLIAQIPSNVYKATLQNEGQAIVQEIKVADGYFILTEYSNVPPTFGKTLGGYYSLENDSLTVQLEFNSDYEKDPSRSLKLSYSQAEDSVEFNGTPFTASEMQSQDLDGAWLFATRGPDTGQERRGDENHRKTLKFLLNQHFQWIAYNTDTMEFFGSGGGAYKAENGSYTETIEYFSRDNTRVGAQLQFSYELEGNDWHHTGKNSKGKPLYEIWSRRR